MLTLKEWRRAKGISVEKLSNEIGVSASTINNWENRGQKIPVTYAIMICNYLDVPIEEVNFFADECYKV